MIKVIAVLLISYVKATFQVIYPVPWVPLLTNSITYRSEDPALENLQIAQFHSQDAAGKYVFGFNTPNQARVEARSHDGKVRGSFSYLDPFGRTVKMEYWDNGHGFHMTGPKGGFPVYTPEVQAARDLHFHLYNRALEAALAAGGAPIPIPIGPINYGEQSEMNDYDDDDDGNYDDGSYHSSQSHDKHDDKDSESIENDKVSSSSASSGSSSSSSSESIPGFPDGPDFSQTDFDKEFPYLSGQSGDYYKQLEEQFDFINGGTPNKEVYDADKESVIVDSASTTYNDGYSNQRTGKHTSFISNDNNSNRRSSVIDSSVNPDEENIKVHVVRDAPAVNSETVVESSVSKNGFFYQFQHPIFPTQLSKLPTPSSPPESLHATLFGAIPIDAVHDTQVSPKQQNIPNHQILPLFVNVPKS
ncbi:uncharacterized protein LOC142330898 [Lycorma delicatula]|uniref:uncharacterized protein LOC142330898 n=1 Tax=Lycorma delicatula TaxID=130591 RepID=UPI003F50FBC3